MRSSRSRARKNKPDKPKIPFMLKALIFTMELFMGPKTFYYLTFPIWWLLDLLFRSISNSPQVPDEEPPVTKKSNKKLTVKLISRE